MEVIPSEADYAKAKVTSTTATRRTTWIMTEYHCRHCGIKPLLVEVGEGDYHVGPFFWCRSCGEIYTMGYHSKTGQTG